MTLTPSQATEKAKSILTGIYLSAEVKEVIKRLRPVDLQEDILQHCFLELFQKPPEIILDLHERGKLKAFIVKILHNTATYTKSTFAKQLGKETPTDFSERKVYYADDTYSEHLDSGHCTPVEYAVVKFQNDEREETETHKEIACCVSNVYWYKADLLKLYAELGTYRAVSEKTGIPHTSVFKTIKDVKKEIRKQL